MRKTTAGLLGTMILLAAVVSASCTDATGPTEAGLRTAPSSPAMDHGAGKQTVVTVQRTSPLARDVVVSAVIGPNGGTIRVEEAGMKVSFSRGAVAEPTTITVRAHAGEGVVYSFAPHGLVFGADVKIEQELEHTHGGAGGGKLLGGYFVGEPAVQQDGSVAVEEIIPTVLHRNHRKVWFNIEHFSGYLLGVG